MKDILFIIGSESDKAAVEPGMNLIAEKNMSADLVVYSAHRNLPELMDFLKNHDKDYKIVITAAGLSAALPGVVAALTKKPVIGIPLIAGAMNGMDALLSILQLPKGVPVATMGIGKQGVLNAVHLSERIIKNFA